MGIVKEIIDAISIDSDGPVDRRGVDRVLPLETTGTKCLTGDDLPDKLLQLLGTEFADKTARRRGMSLGVLVLSALGT